MGLIIGIVIIIACSIFLAKLYKTNVSLEKELNLSDENYHTLFEDESNE
jgi:hypothetical protein